MAIQDAIILRKDTISVTSNDIVKDAVSLIKKNDIRMVPVIDGEEIIGIFSLRSIIRAVLPKGLTLDENLPDMEFIHGVTEDLAERLKDVQQDSVTDIMKKDFLKIHPETSTTETLRHLYQEGYPLPVTDKQTGAFLGIVTEQSMLKFLEKKMK